MSFFDLLNQIQQVNTSTQQTLTNAINQAITPTPTAPKTWPTVEKTYDADSGSADVATNSTNIAIAPKPAPAPTGYVAGPLPTPGTPVPNIHREEQDGTVTIYEDEFQRVYLYPKDGKAVLTMVEGGALCNLASYTRYMKENPDKISDVGARLRNGLAVCRYEGAQGAKPGLLSYLGHDWDWQALGGE